MRCRGGRRVDASSRFIGRLVHVITDIYRHAGHADLLRELIDGAVGADRRWSNLPPGDEAWWTSYRDKVKAAALQAGEAPDAG